MAKTKITIAYDVEVAREARRVAGPRGLSRLVNAAMRRHLQAIRMREAEEELTARYGPISEEAERRVEEFEWPR